MTKKLVLSATMVGLVVFVAKPNDLRAKETRTPREASTPLVRSLDSGPSPFGKTMRAAPDTTWVASWDFEGCDAQGWTAQDLTAQGIYTHVDDFAGLGGGYNGLLFAPGGNQAMWCGLAPNPADPVLCGYATLPGYGNRWQQFLTTSSPAVGTGLTLSFAIHYDSEPGYDFTFLEVDDATDPAENWINLGVGNTSLNFDAAWGFFGTDTVTVAIPDSLHGGQVDLRFRFTSDGAWSDQDGLWQTDGAFIVDDIGVTATVGPGLPFDDFEDESVGDMSADNWEASSRQAFGTFASLFPGTQAVSEDFCTSNISCIWGFFEGSGYVYDCGGNNFPGQEVVPFGTEGPGVLSGTPLFINNEIWSPAVPLIGSGESMELQFDVYRDLPLGNVVFWVWHVRSIVDGCPGQWEDNGFVFYGAQKDWSRQSFPIGDLIEQGATDVQVALGVVDLCNVWCGTFGPGTCHSHAPMFDNVSIIRFDGNGPQWTINDARLFQDSFPGDGTITGTVRADMGTDISQSFNPILFGDSVVVEVFDTEHGLGTTGSGAAAVFLYAAVCPQGQAGKSGAALSGGPRWPYQGTGSAGGIDWAVIQMDTSFNIVGNPQDRTFCADLNDNLFTPGDTVKFFFGATNSIGEVTYWGLESGVTDDFATAAAGADEFTCLPTGTANVLYVDGAHTFGEQAVIDAAFDHIALSPTVDRYDVRGSDNYNNNRLGGTVVNVANQLNSAYDCIVWSTGNQARIMGDGDGNPEDTDDTGILFSFLENATGNVGLYLLGNELPSGLEILGSISASQLKNKYIDFGGTSGSHTAEGIALNPLILGAPGSLFHGDSMNVDGACLTLSNAWTGEGGFDVITDPGSMTMVASYVGGGGAVAVQETLNPNGYQARVVLGGFAASAIYDDHPAPIPDYIDHLGDVMMYLAHIVPVSTPPSAPRVNELTQNYPNPFNPTTTISYSLANRAHVQLKVYNVSGQLVRTLVDQVQTPAQVAPITWDGTNNAGTQVSSGVYFYRLVAGDFVRTRKMVLLK